MEGQGHKFPLKQVRQNWTYQCGSIPLVAAWSQLAKGRAVHAVALVPES